MDQFRQTVIKEGVVLLVCTLIGFVAVPLVLTALAGMAPREFYESLFSPVEMVISWSIALAPYVLCQVARLALPFLKPRSVREEIRLVPEYLKCVAVVVGTAIAFLFIWTLFSWRVNPLLVWDIMEHGAAQSRAHLLAMDSLGFIRNHGVVSWWCLAALLYFFWTARKKPERAKARRTGLALFLLPFVALTVVFVVAAFQQVRMPNNPSVLRHRGDRPGSLG